MQNYNEILDKLKDILSKNGAINYQEDFEQLLINKQLLDYMNTNYKYTDILNVLVDSMEADIKDKI